MNQKRLEWTEEEITLLSKMIRENASIEDLCKAFPNHRQSSIKYKKSQLQQKDSTLPQPLPQGKPWLDAELRIIDEGIAKQLTTKQIAEQFPERTFNAVDYRVRARFKEIRREGFDTKDLVKKKWIKVSEEKYPGERVTTATNSHYFVILKSFFQNIELAVLTIREALIQAEKASITMITCYVIDSSEDLANTTRIISKGMKEAINVPSNLEDLVRASMLADGTCAKRSDNCFYFQFTQTCNISSKNEASHLEYVLWFLNQIPMSYLTPGFFFINRGIKLATPKNDLSYSWKARVNLRNWFFFGEMYDENYTKSNSTHLTTLGKNSTRNHKVLPSVDILIKKYFRNPGLTLAHIHMQDGSLRYVNKEVSLPALHIQTVSEEEAIKICWVIFKTTGLKYFIGRTAYPIINPENKVVQEVDNLESEAFQSVNRFICYLTPSSIDLFIKLTEPYILPCFNYKQPKAIKNTVSAAKADFIERYETYFEQSVLNNAKDY